ncbi:ABC transporter permease [Tenacibaculum sp. ZS6-P6]|uniref:ABC transporter permease n=1 Tax=Tenacibaculum sp. ZS6-P6 TaxID=3447503 RepID=UPI003F9E33EC
MKSINYFISGVKNELIKLKNTSGFWLSLICALLLPLVFFILYLLKHEKFIVGDEINPWLEFIKNQEDSLSLLTSIYTIVIISLIVQIEHKSSTFKYLFTLPIPKWSIYFGKLLLIILLLLAIYLLFYISIIISGNLLGLIYSDLNFNSFSPDYSLIFKNISKSFIPFLGLVGIQYWLSFRIKNFIIPISIGLLLLVVGIVLITQKVSFTQYYAYAYNIIGQNPNYNNISLYSLLYLILFSTLGYIDIRRLNIK